MQLVFFFSIRCQFKYIFENIYVDFMYYFIKAGSVYCIVHYLKDIYILREQAYG